MSFAERMGFVPTKLIQISSIDEALKNRLFNYFFNCFNNDDYIKYILDKMGYITGSSRANYLHLQEIFIESNSWCHPYDIYEYLFEYLMCNTKTGRIILKDYMDNINNILSEERSGYRMVEGKFVSITSETELEEIQTAMHSKFNAVDTHIQKALALYSDRKQPDYENSIKESISAVEAMCCIITNLQGSQATLGKAIKKLEDSGIEIHGSMKSAMDKLYGYTSDQDGIRHGGIDFKNAPEEDARYMLVSCSAFVNYLKEKYVKSQNGGNTNG